ncbi:hypothetical protein PSTG_11010 [Puccinia striiformis f. sp. tritici PST-78]|uniref:CCR4-Not complex 3'-5'-exoribonuclease subunit Ccr4 n=1 Tax=Puccinia striiformis f. sp. tritici PST-78 TaxID=1165861 RepID=A0A0L0V8N4_9BASI|nr:hypothetical protein PSTG_11010 [Puccinia striiformis f. sp. tritici PST-78]
MYHPPNGHLANPTAQPGRWQSTQLIKQLSHYPATAQQPVPPSLHHHHQQQQQQQQHQQQPPPLPPHHQQQQQQQQQHLNHPHHSHQQHHQQQHTSSFNYPPNQQQQQQHPHQPSIYHQSQPNSHPSYLSSPAPIHQTNANSHQPISAQSNSHHQQQQQPQPQLPTPLTPSWAKQVEHAQISRASSAAHHHARAAQLQIRGQASAALTITDPNRPPKPILLHHNPSQVVGRPTHSNSLSNSSNHLISTSKFNDHNDPIRNMTVQSIISSSNSSNQSDRTSPNSPTDTSLTSSTATANGPQNEPPGSQKHHHHHQHQQSQHNRSSLNNNLNNNNNTGWTTVDMGGLKLKSLSESLFSYDFLTTLYIPHNSLTSLSPLIARLNSLTILDVSSNKLTSLPAELGMITTLQHLFVFDNHLTSLPPELGSLHQLEELGVEGNPLTDSLLSTIQKEGTASLVAYLRDSCPVPLPPSERDWITIDSSDSSHQPYSSSSSTTTTSNSPSETFTTMCYNILCERYATDRMYGYTPSWALNWEYRKDLILQELMQYGADIICLQEVDVEQYEDFFVQSLKDQGYEGVFYPKSRARTMGSEERRHVDGCATFFKTSMFQLIERECVEFNQIPMRSESHKTEDMFNRVMTKDNIAVIALLEHRQTGTRQIVANVHIHWDPEFRDVKLIQTAMLMDQITEISNRFARLPKRTNLNNTNNNNGYNGGNNSNSSRNGSIVSAPNYKNGHQIPTIICGDFNSIPKSGVYEYLSQGKISSSHPDFCSNNYGPYTDQGIRHDFKLKSAYSHLSSSSSGSNEENELPFTNYTPGFKGVIDYIWYSTASLNVIGLLGKIDDLYLSKVVGFPNAHFASDHVPVLAEFKVKPVPN